MYPWWLQFWSWAKANADACSRDPPPHSLLLHIKQLWSAWWGRHASAMQRAAVQALAVDPNGQQRFLDWLKAWGFEEFAHSGAWRAVIVQLADSEPFAGSPTFQQCRQERVREINAVILQS